MNDNKLFQAHRTAALTAVAALTFTAGCRSHTQAQTASNQDPAAANLAQPYTGGNAGGYNNGQTQVLSQNESYSAQSAGESYETQAPAPIIRQAAPGTQPTQYYPVPQAQSSQASYQQGYSEQQGYNDQPAPAYNDAEEAGEQALAETDQAPPPLPEYDQPPAPEDDYLWTPGYWNYASSGYYWVPGAWVAPPFYGALWTPPYWGYSNNHYLFHRGYWGPHVGYYGGVNYGFGYIGVGYFGGYWRGHDFYYNRAVTNVNVERIHNVYQRPVVWDNRTYGPRPDNRISYNGGRGGLNVQPRPQELAAMREAHYAPLPVQRELRQSAASNREQFYSANHGRPAQAVAPHAFGSPAAIAATPREQAFNLRGAPNQPAMNGNNRPGDLNRPGTPNQPGAFNNRPGTTGAPAFAGRPGESNRPGTPNQPNVINNRPGEYNRGATPNQPGMNNRPGEFNRDSTPGLPATNMNRPGEFNRPGSPATQPGFNGRPADANRPATINQPAPNANRPADLNRPAAPGAQPYPGTGSYNGARPGDFHRNLTPGQPAPATTDAQRGGTQPQRQFQPQPQQQQQQQQPRPNFQQQQQQQQPRPNFQQQQQQPRPNFQQPQQQQQPRPNFQQQQQQQPRPNFQQQHQDARPQMSAPRQAPSPAPHVEAPHNNGGGDHGHNH